MNISADDRDDGLIFLAAEGFLALVCHEGLDFFHGTWDAGEQLHAICHHCDVILDTHLPIHTHTRNGRVFVRY